AAANVNDHLLLRETIETIVIERPAPTPEAPQHLCLDADYDNPTGREAAAAGKYTPHIVPVRKEKRSSAQQTVTVTPTSTLRADAQRADNGGRVSIRADQSTAVDGTVSAQGGPVG